MIRFQRIGRTNDPAYRIVVLEKERAAKTGRILEQLGTYNPKTKAFTLDVEKAKMRIGNGAQLTGTVHNLFISKGVIEGKKVNVLPKKTVAPAPTEAEEKKEAAPAAPVAAAAPVAEAAPAEPTEAEVAADAAPAEEPKAEETPAA